MKVRLAYPKREISWIRLRLMQIQLMNKRQRGDAVKRGSLFMEFQLKREPKSGSWKIMSRTKVGLNLKKD